MAERSKAGSGGHKPGQFNAFRYKPRKKVELTPVLEETAEAVPTTVSGAGMTSASLADLNSAKVKHVGHSLAGQRCQAPKGDGICGAVISARNPYKDIPICQPCAGRLRDQARESGQAPDLEKIWKKLVARRESAAKASELASRPSGVREVAPSSNAEGKPAISVAVAKEIAG